MKTWDWNILVGREHGIRELVKGREKEKFIICQPTNLFNYPK